MPTTFSKTFINWFFPPSCVHCHTEGAWLCPEARNIVAREKIFPLLEIPEIQRTFIRGSYDNPVLQQVIKGVKYSYWHGASDCFENILEPLRQSLRMLPSETVIVPVPLHRRRWQHRGFNQSALIATSLGHLMSWSTQALLIRHRYTKAQAQLSEAERLTNVQEAFGLRSGLARLPSSAILVDDVLTTGSTFSECAKVLRSAGIRNIYACAIAKG